MTRLRRAAGERPLFWVGSAKEDLLAFPDRVKDSIGVALSVAQFGGMHPAAKPWKGSGSGIFEVVADHRRGTYRAVYTVRFRRAIYVLHAFQKKSPKGVKTPRSDVERIAQRLRMAREDYEARYGQDTV